PSISNPSRQGSDRAPIANRSRSKVAREAPASSGASCVMRCCRPSAAGLFDLHGTEIDPGIMDRPLLVVDGDSFAHRAYHALPKSIRREGNRGAGAIVGFANFLLLLYDSQRPRALIVGWDTYG